MFQRHLNRRLLLTPYSLYLCLAVAGPHVGGHRDILIDGFVPPSTGVAPMFPFYENTSEWDDFGEVINPEDYVIKDEDMDQAAMQVSFYP